MEHETLALLQVMEGEAYYHEHARDNYKRLIGFEYEREKLDREMITVYEIKRQFHADELEDLENQINMIKEDENV